MVWDGMTQEEQVIAQTVISGEEDWVVWRTKPAQSKLGENAAGDQIHQEAMVFLEEFGTRPEGVCCRDMEIWVPKAGIAPAPDWIKTVWEA
jgi:hypothetical protein